MAQKIGNEPPHMVFQVELNLDVPKLLAILATSETHIKRVRAIQMLSVQLENISKKAIEINNPELTELLIKMKLLKVITDKGEDYSDI